MIGNVVGNYKITDKLGEGGMGAVYKGVDLMLEREVAIKVLRPEYASQPQLVERFRSEAVTLAKLNHPNVATLHNFFRQGADFFMVMEFVRGETLEAIIQRTGPLPVGQAVPLFCQALEGIGHAHSIGIVHRDIKPANMMLTQDGTLKVMDFGIARVLGTSRMTKQGNIIGTIEYMSPEQVQGLETDARSDIYSLGILLYELLTGRLPFAADTEFKLMMAQIQATPTPPRQFAAHIPVPLEAAIMRALAKRPEMRFQTAGEFRATLERILQEAGIAPRPAPAVRVRASQPDMAAPGTPAPGTPIPGTPVPGTPIPGTPASIPTPVTPAPAPNSGETIKATRLGSGDSLPGASTDPTPETRLGQVGAIQPGYIAQQPGYGYAPPPPPPPRSGNASKLIVFAGVAVLLIAALVGGAVFMIGGPKDREEPAPAAPAPSPRVAEPQQPTPQPQPSTPKPAAVEPPAPAGINNLPTEAPPQVTDTSRPSKPEPNKPARQTQRDKARSADAAAKERERRRREALRALDQ